jgi:hypothetical protein
MELVLLLIILNYVPCENQGSLETWTTVHGNTLTGTITSTST